MVEKIKDLISKKNDDVKFINICFQSMIGRDPSEKEIESFILKINAGANRKKIISEIFFSDESVRVKKTPKHIRDYLFWEIIFKKIRLSFSMVFFGDDILRPNYNEKMPNSTVAGRRVNTPVELLLLNDREFIASLYKNLFQRSPDAKGFKHYLKKLRNGDDKRSIVASFISSSEGKTHSKFALKGLGFAIFPYQYMKYPVLGSVLKFLMGENSAKRRLRALENSTYHFLSRNYETPSVKEVGKKNLIRNEFYKNSDYKNKKSHFVDSRHSTVFFYIDHTVSCPANSGLQRLARQLARGLLAEGRSIVFVKWDPEVKRLLRITQSQLDHFSQWNGPAFSEADSKSYPDSDEFKSYIDFKDVTPGDWLLVPEVTHINYHGSDQTVDVMMAGRSLRLKLAYIYYDAIPLRLKEYASGSEVHEKYMQALLLTDLILPISERSHQELRGFFQKYQKATFIPRIRTAALAGETNLAPRVRVPSESVRNKIILCVGSMDIRKNQLSLARAFDVFSQTEQGKDWTLILAGHASAFLNEELNRPPLSKNKKIKIIHTPSDSDLDDLYRQADFTVFPSIEEGFGLPILESLWYGKPCICANFGAMAEVADGGGCLTINTHNVDEIFLAIERLATEKGLLHRLSQEAVVREIKSWSDYSKFVNNELTVAGSPLTGFEGIYYWVDSTAKVDFNSGIQRVVRQLARGLINAGVKVIPVCWNEKDRSFMPPTHEQLSNLARWNGPQPEDWSPWISPNESKSAPKWFLMPELVHGILGDVREAAVRQGLRCSAIFYDAIPYKMRDDFPANFSENHGRYLDDVADFDKVISISNYSHNDFWSYCLGKKKRNPDAERRFVPIPLPNQLVEYPRTVDVDILSDSEIRILSVISMEPRKNPLVLLDAFEAAAKKSAKPMSLTLVGRSIASFAELAKEVALRVEKSPLIRWEQGISDEEIQKLYKEATFTIFPSLEEGFGLPIVESLWNGRPCIVHDGGSMAEIAEEGGCLKTDMMDKQALTNAILSLANDQELLRKLSAQAVKRPVQTWVDYAQNIVNELVMDRALESDKVEWIQQGEEILEEFSNLRPRPKLSVCISTYNRAGWLQVNLRHLLHEVAAVSDKVEVLVVDNASTDNTAEIVESFLDDKPYFRFVRNDANVGMLGNLTVTAHEARGEYIWILGDDDLIKPGALQKILGVIETHPDISLIYPHYSCTYEKDPSNVSGDIGAFIESCPMTSPATEDQFGFVHEIAPNNENLFTAIYCLIFRRDHALRAYSQDTSGRPFSTMKTSIPTTYYVLNYMMQEKAYWIGQPMLVVNFNVSWNKYASLQILERVPEAQDLAERMGSDSLRMDRWRENLMPGFVHYWTEILENDQAENAPFFSPDRVVMRMKHLDKFSQIVPDLLEVYERARLKKNPVAQMPARELFAAFQETAEVLLTDKD